MILSMRTELVSNAKIIGQILKRQNLVKNYTKYFAVLSGAYIYFFTSYNDETFQSYFNLSESSF